MSGAERCPVCDGPVTVRMTGAETFAYESTAEAALREAREALAEAVETLDVQNNLIRGELSENLGSIITDGRIERYRAVLARGGEQT